MDQEQALDKIRDFQQTLLMMSLTAETSEETMAFVTAMVATTAELVRMFAGKMHEDVYVEIHRKAFREAGNVVARVRAKQETDEVLRRVSEGRI